MQQKTSRTFTYHTRLLIDDKVDEILTKQAKVLSKVERHLLVDYYFKNKNINELKSQYLKKFNITARQFNSCRIKLEGKVKSVQELFKKTVGLLEEKIKKLKKYVKWVRIWFSQTLPVIAMESILHIYQRASFRHWAIPKIVLLSRETS